MACLLYFIILITIQIIASYTILNRILHQLDNQRLLSHTTLTHSTSVFNECIPLQAVKQLHCPFSKEDFLYYKFLEPVCKQHRLCYACGFVHGITERKCDKFSQMYMYELCSKNASSKSDCLKTRFLVLIILRQNIYRLSEFSFECSDKCVFNYLSNPE